MSYFVQRQRGSKGSSWDTKPCSYCSGSDCPIMAIQYTGEFKNICSEVKRIPNSRLYSMLVV